MILQVTNYGAGEKLKDKELIHCIDVVCEGSELLMKMNNDIPRRLIATYRMPWKVVTDGVDMFFEDSKRIIKVVK